jgi:hypothetical protein
MGQHEQGLPAGVQLPPPATQLVAAVADQVGQYTRVRVDNGMLAT